MLKHKHLIIRADVDKPFTDCDKAANWLSDLVKEINMNITNSGGPHVDYVEKEGNCGIAGVVMIETSHISLHIWDKQDPPLLQMDVYSCADYNENAVIAFLSEMEPSHIEYMLIDREKSLNVSEETVTRHHLVNTDFTPNIDPLGLSF